MISRSRLAVLGMMMVGGGAGLALVTARAISNEAPAPKKSEASAPAAEGAAASKASDGKTSTADHGAPETQASAKPAGDTAVAEKSKSASARTQASKAPSTGCIVDEQAVSDLKHRWLEVDQRAQELQAREAELKAKERAVDEEYKKVLAAKDELEVLRGGLKKENEEKIAKIVETLESMSPKSSAQLLSTLDEPLAVKAIQRLSTQKLAKVLAGMEPARAARLTEVMAGVDKARKPAQKGGEAHDGFNPITTPGQQQPTQPGQSGSSAFVNGDGQVAQLGN